MTENTQFRKALNEADNIPAYLFPGMLRWVEEGITPGGFLEAVISNDLVNAILRGDDLAQSRLVDITKFVYMNFPAGALGKPALAQWPLYIQARNRQENENV